MTNPLTFIVSPSKSRDQVAVRFKDPTQDFTVDLSVQDWNRVHRAIHQTDQRTREAVQRFRGKRSFDHVSLCPNTEPPDRRLWLVPTLRDDQVVLVVEEDGYENTFVRLDKTSVLELVFALLTELEE